KLFAFRYARLAVSFSVSLSRFFKSRVFFLTRNSWFNHCYFPSFCQIFLNILTQLFLLLYFFFWYTIHHSIPTTHHKITSPSQFMFAGWCDDGRWCPCCCGPSRDPLLSNICISLAITSVI